MIIRHQWTGGRYGPRALAHRRTCDGIRFDSIAEMNRYQELKMLQDAGQITVFLTQNPVFRFPGGGRYTADFLIFWADGRVTVEDVKGRFRTERYRSAKRQVEAMYAPITITEVESR